MKRLIAAISLTALTAVVGQTVLPPQARAAEPAGHVVSTAAAGAQTQEQAFADLIARAARKNNPNATAADIDRIIAALTDIGKIIATVDPADVTRVAAGIAEAAAAVAELTATGNPDAARRVLCGSGNAAAGSMAILSRVVRMYEASANLPQIAEVLNLLDPRTPEGAKLFNALPDFAKTPETRAALISLTELGRVLNKIDKQAVIGLARDWAEAAAKCDVRTLLELPGLMLRTFQLSREILGLLVRSNLGAMGKILAPTAVN